MAGELNKKDYLTTSQAARILSVSPDAVLKWARAGKIEAYRTPGGHFRIPKTALSGVDARAGDGLIRVEEPPATHQYCWEYLAKGGEVKPECLECITYRSRSRRCYELRDLPEGLGCLRVYCKSNCSECDYYRMVQGESPHVILLGNMSTMLRIPSELEHVEGLQIETAASEYECAMLIERFRPDYVVVDCSLGKKRTGNFCTSLFNDPRIPVPRVILASRTTRLKDYCDKEVFGWITRPFTLDQLLLCISNVRAA